MGIKPLKLSDRVKCKGFYIICRECKTTLSRDQCPKVELGKNCPYPERQSYKAVAHIKGTRNSRTTKLLETRNIDEAVKQTIEYTKESNQRIKSFIHEKGIKENVDNGKDQPRLFIDAAAMYVSFLKGENKPLHQKRIIRTDAHVKDVIRTIKSFMLCMKANKVDMLFTRIDQITDDMVGLYHSFLLKEKKYQLRTYDKKMTLLTSFISYANSELKVNVVNHFKNAERFNRINSVPESISSKELQSLYQMAIPEKSIKVYENGSKRFLYRDYFIPACKLGIETGRRREELINMKWTDIKTDPEGNECIMIEDYKANRITHRISEQSKKYVYVPITKTLKVLLIEFGYNQNKNLDQYILAPEINGNRVRKMSDAISKSFSHYYDQLGTGRHLTFKCLRKTYITNLSLFMNNPRAITGHSSDSVMDGHYIDRRAVAMVAKDFSVFRKETKENEIKEIRNNKSKDISGKEID